MRDVVVGGRGWVSRASIAVLRDKFGVGLESLSVYGRSNREHLLSNSDVLMIKQWSDGITESDIRYFLPFAFLTVDKFNKLGEDSYRLINRSLIKRATDFISRNEPEYCVLISSGIVHSNLSINKRSSAYQVYRQLKLEEEEAIRKQCEETGTNVLICRLFSASGRFISDLQRYALGNFIYQGLKHGKIVVESPHRIMRRYVDMEQLLEICLLAVQEQPKIEFDSSGSLIELHNLASMCARELNISYAEKEYRFDEADNYYSNSTDLERLSELYKIQLFAIERQVKETIKGVKGLMSTGSYN